MTSLFTRLIPPLLVLVGCTFSLSGATVSIHPVADTSLFEKFPDNNLGASDNFPVGTVTKSDDRSRALIRFAIGASVPKGSTISSVSLQIHIPRDPSNPMNSVFELRRVNVSWNEGTQAPKNGNLAADGETSWNHREAPSTGWTTPGGGIESDFLATVSSTVMTGAEGDFVFSSTDHLVADVQAWVNDPSSNYGWVIMNQSDSTRGTARRVSSRESNQAPVLTITFEPPPGWISNITVGSSMVSLEWQDGTPSFLLQSSPAISPASWTNEGMATSSTSASLPQNGTERFYRVIPDYEASYTLTFNAVWSPTSHPASYPGGAHWSGLTGGTHNGEVTFWEIGQLASRGVKDVAERGSTSQMRSEVSAAISAGTANQILAGGGLGSGSGTVQMTFTANKSFPLATVISMIAPSPDWFIGVGGLSLVDEEGEWLDEIVVSLNLYDAGTDDGASYASGNSPATTPQPIFQRTEFPAKISEQLVPFGTFTFTRNPLPQP